MARRSTIETHPQRALIENAIASGEKGSAIARQYGVSDSAISRHKNSRMVDDPAMRKAGEGDPTDVMRRLLDVADSARRARQIADLAGTPATKAKAQAVELQVLNVLSERLGIDAVTPIYLSEIARLLFVLLHRLATNRPDIRDELIALMRQDEALDELADELSTALGGTP